jgi:hypothetical protein
MKSLPQEALEILANRENNPNHGGLEFVVCGRMDSPCHLQAALAMLMARCTTVSHVKTEGSVLTFSQSYGDVNGFVALPFPLDVIGVVQMTESWLRQLPRNQWPGQPDHDGSNSPGWRVSTVGYWDAFQVSFKWIEHHK